MRQPHFFGAAYFVFKTLIQLKWRMNFKLCEALYLNKHVLKIFSNRAHMGYLVQFGKMIVLNHLLLIKVWYHPNHYTFENFQGVFFPFDKKKEHKGNSMISLRD